MPRPIRDGGFVFEPRSKVLHARSFGKTSQIPAPSGPVDDRFRGAVLQHLIADAIRQALLSEGHTLRSFVNDKTEAVPAAMSYDRAVRILRGETAMPLSDLTFWVRRFPSVGDAIVRATTAEWLIKET
jgi:hypothetical protein